MSLARSMISVLATRSNQRLGDLAAGTLVVRDPRAQPAVAPAHEDASAVASWDVSAVSQEDLLAVRTFLSRRDELHARARQDLAAQLAGRLRPRVAGAGGVGGDEPFLEDFAAAKARAPDRA